MKTINSFEHRATITVHLGRQFRFRIWLGTQIFRLGARVVGAGYVKIKENAAQDL